MPSDNIERFREHSVYPNHPSKEGEYVLYSDHERTVEELEAHIAARDALLDPSRPSLSDAIKEVERLYDEWWDVDRRRWLNVVLERLKALSERSSTSTTAED